MRFCILCFAVGPKCSPREGKIIFLSSRCFFALLRGEEEAAGGGGYLWKGALLPLTVWLLHFSLLQCWDVAMRCRAIGCAQATAGFVSGVMAPATFGRL